MTRISYSKANPLVPPNRDARRANKARDRRGKPIMAAADSEAKTAKGVKSRKPARAAAHAKLKKPVEAVKPEVDRSTAHVTGMSDKHGKRWVQVVRGEVKAIGSVEMLMADQKSFFADLALQGLCILNSAMRRDVVNQVDLIGEDDWPCTIYVAETAGFHCGAHVLPDGRIIGKPMVPNFKVHLRHQIAPLSKKGTLKGQQAAIARFVDGQEIFVLAIGVALVGPLLSLLGLGNVGVDLTGKSSTGKSTALNVGACSWGAPLEQRGSIALALLGTLAGFEQQMLARHSAVFFGDEANLLASFGGGRRGIAQANLSFLLGAGSEKKRYDAPEGKRARFGFLITSNASMRSQLSGEDRNSVEAALVRLMVVPADTGAAMGVLNRLPAGCGSSSEAIEALKDELKANHGHIAPAFLKAMLRERKRDKAALIASAKKRMEQFLAHAHVDRNDGAKFRKAQALAAIYAALKLAVDWGVLPLQGVGPLLLACYRRMSAFAGQEAQQTSAIGRVHTYVETNREALQGLNTTKRSSMSEADLAAHPGIRTKRDGRWVLLMSPKRWKATFGNDARRMLEELKRQSHLQTTGEGLQVQIKVRQNKAHDRMYAIIIK